MPLPNPGATLVTAFVLAVVAAASLLFPNRVIRRRMTFTLFVVAGLVAFHASVRYHVFTPTDVLAHSIEELFVAFALLNTAVALLFNPWFADRVRDRAPGIVQDAIVTGLFLVVALSLYQDKAELFATSAVAAAVLGFALQETLGNAFAGLAIQTEKPFRVGHWVAVAGYEGRVTEVTWRATKVRTKAGSLVVLPNNVVAREAITNYTEPSLPNRLFVEVGAAYGAPPNFVRDAMLTAIRRCPDVLETPSPDVLLMDFGASAITYRGRFWIDDFEREDHAKQDVRTAIYYEFARRNIEIPWPIQVEYSRHEVAEDPGARMDRYGAILARVPVLAPLQAEGRRALAAGAVEHMYAHGEPIVREGAPGATMFVVCKGTVKVTIGNGHEVARISDGGYFGEMSLLTGEPRSATVVAAGDVTVLEIGAEIFREYVTNNPEVIDPIAAAAAGRRRELEESRAAATVTASEARKSLADRMRRFFGLA